MLIEAKVLYFFSFLYYLENYLDYGLCRHRSSLHLEKQNSWFIHICNANESSVYEENSSLSVIPRVLKAFFTSSCSSLWHSWRASFDSWLLFEVAGGKQLQTKQLLQPELIVLGRCFLFKIYLSFLIVTTGIWGYYETVYTRKRRKEWSNTISETS